LLYKGVRTKEDYFYFQKRIAQVQSLADNMKNIGEYEAYAELGVSTIYMGYPFNIAQDRGNKFTVNVWSYRRLMDVIELKAQEYGMRVFEVVEYDASKYCAFTMLK
jgi:putative transposase